MTQSLRLTLLAGATLLASGLVAAAQEVNLYTHREPGLIKPILDKFTAETGVKVNLVFAGSGLAERIQSEGERSPADLLLSVDVSTLTQAVALGITQPIVTPALEKAVPKTLRAADGSWVAVSARARVIYASKDRVKDPALTYEDLANPRFKGKVCTRPGTHAYNTGLISAAIAHMGPEKAEAWLKGVRANLAKKPSGGDRDVAKDIAAGICDVGVANMYYVGLMNKDPNQKAWVDAIRVVMPSFQNGGTHMNMSGLVLTKHAKNKAEAIRLAEWLVSPAAQELYAANNFEYPVVEGVSVEPFIAGFGKPRVDSVSLDDVAKNRKAASELVEKVGYDLGPQS
ncbi:MAG: extracellular solute-binding protein [Beijerinckiaceae bacterium]|nr:extracellular solute-binding protein [Beijerinckiaceae bacterium]MCZ8300004.1 extracellular solute-binding protein [Beijerinckiaceae bacterium]